MVEQHCIHRARSAEYLAEIIAILCQISVRKEVSWNFLSFCKWPRGDSAFEARPLPVSFARRAL